MAQVFEDFQKMSWFVPEYTTLNMNFYQKVFLLLDEAHQDQDAASTAAGQGNGGDDSNPNDQTTAQPPAPAGSAGAKLNGLPLSIINRAMSRLFYLLQEPRTFDARIYDINGDGIVGWWEFWVVWKEKDKPHIHMTTMERIHLVFEDPQASRLGRILSIVVLVAIIFSAGSFIISTLPSMQERRDKNCDECAPEPLEVFGYIDIVCVGMFTVEYVARLFTALFTRQELVDQERMIRIVASDAAIRGQSKFQRFLSFSFNISNIIDLASILPSYVSWIVQEKSEWLQMIRLMRVARAFRLCRRFEAVIIIGQAIRSSERAIRVLLLNVSFSMLVLGAMMFFVEQGKYDPEQRVWKRKAGIALNSETMEWEDVWDLSPFKSIPHSFWWALVTATTAGYGDDVPSTASGKAVTAIAMVWGLCVLALPVGVIGGNFTSAWDDYDREKKIECDLKSAESRMVTLKKKQIEPIHFARHIHIEVYHDSQLGPGNNIFVGEAEVELDLPAELPVAGAAADGMGDGVSKGAEIADGRLCKRLTVPLQDNWEKAKRTVRGAVVLDYTWEPQMKLKEDQGMLLKGVLSLTLVKAHDLAEVDWKRNSLPDPFVVMTVYPRAPGKTSPIEEVSSTSKTVFDKAIPEWNETSTFDMSWHVEGVEAQKRYQRQSLSNWADTKGTKSTNNKDSVAAGEFNFVALLPELTCDVQWLKTVIPKMVDDLQEIRQGTRQILADLAGQVGLPLGPEGAKDVGPAQNKASEDGERAGGTQPPGQSSSSPPGGALTPRSQAQEAESGFQFVVPGVVPEDATADGANATPRS